MTTILADFSLQEGILHNLQSLTFRLAVCNAWNQRYKHQPINPEDPMAFLQTCTSTPARTVKLLKILQSFSSVPYIHPHYFSEACKAIINKYPEATWARYQGRIREFLSRPGVMEQVMDVWMKTPGLGDNNSHFGNYMDFDKRQEAAEKLMEELSIRPPYTQALVQILLHTGLVPETIPLEELQDLADRDSYRNYTPVFGKMVSQETSPEVRKISWTTYRQDIVRYWTQSEVVSNIVSHWISDPITDKRWCPEHLLELPPIEAAKGLKRELSLRGSLGPIVLRVMLEHGYYPDTVSVQDLVYLAMRDGDPAPKVVPRVVPAAVPGAVPAAVPAVPTAVACVPNYNLNPIVPPAAAVAKIEVPDAYKNDKGEEVPEPSGLDHENKCTVCMDCSTKTIVLNCGHIYMCITCARLQKDTPTCAICRQPIAKIVKTYIVLND